MFEWAWGKGKEYFPDGFLKAGPPKTHILKYLACEIIKNSLTKTKDSELLEELDKFRTIFPQAAITTNYDTCLEDTLEGYHPIVGKDVYKYRIESMGEIYKIHGTVEDPASIVLTTEDYESYSEKRRYISAKMITMFAENPVFILGYGLGDENVAKIICDVGEVIADDNGFIDNIIFVQRQKEMAPFSVPDTLPITSDSRTFHIRRMVQDKYLELFDVLAEPASLSNVRPQHLKAFMTRLNEVVRVDIPLRRVEVTYDHIERITNNPKEIPQLLGFSIRDSRNTEHPYTLGHIAEALDFRSERGVASPGQIYNKVIKVLKNTYGFDIQAGDNKYHEKIKTGKAKSSFTRKYSKFFYDVAKAMRDEIPIEVDAKRGEIIIRG